MKIAVNTRLLIKNRLEGIGWFTYETLSRICRSHPEHEFLFIFDRKFDKEFIFSDNVKAVIIPPPARHPILWYIWFEHSIPKILEKEKADIFVSPDGYLSLKTKVPSVAIIHDINFYHRPDDLPFLTRNYYNHFFPRFAHKSNRLGTVSEYSREDIHNSYGVENSIIDVIYNGVNEFYKPLNNNEIQNVKDEITGGIPYFIFIGSLHPRKNIPNLLKAYELFRQTYKNPFRLVIVGEKMFMNSEIDLVLSRMKYNSEVIFTGRLEQEKLRRVLASAIAMTFIPYFEGFGIPVLEAMSCGVPVIASNETSLPEVADDAALLCSPDDLPAIAECMYRFATDDNLRKLYIERGLRRSSEFSWDISAGKFWDLIEKTMQDA
jgi:glycosyltransferase involved in cell wall biosynthesis